MLVNTFLLFILLRGKMGKYSIRCPKDRHALVQDVRKEIFLWKQ